MVQRSLSSTSRKSQKDDVPPGYSVDESAGPMLRFQQSLPRLPVPPLSSTLHKYLETVQPHLTPEEFAHTQAAVRSFAESPIGAELQKRLEARRVEPGMKNWLADWWNDFAYMAYRDPVVVNVSYFYVHQEIGKMGSAAERAARLIKAMLPFRELVETRRLEPERVRGIPLCMDSYRWLFNACRYPSKPSDTAYKYPPGHNNYIVFIRRGRFFEVALEQDGRELTVAELEQQIKSIIASCMSYKPDNYPVGVLTSENRDTWAEAREHLALTPENAIAFERIEKAVVIFCLDESKPVTREELSWACWTGDGRNRWYDKHQFIVFDNGRSGFLGEHSCMDGTPTLRLNEYMLASLAAGKVDRNKSGVRENLTQPKEINFEQDQKSIRYIKSGEKQFDELVGRHELLVLHYEGYGKNFIKTQRASPDAWAQMVKQLAFHKLEGRPGVCYESSQTRKFQLGRTEVIRSASNESKAWVEAMLDPNRTDAYRSQLFKRAIARHLQYSTWAADGQGVDRHLFGLKKMLREDEPLPEIFSDPAYSLTSHWELSTSQLSSPFLDGWGYGEVVPNGYGLSYSIGDDYIRWTITSQSDLKRHAAALRHYLAEAATETRKMMERAGLEEKANVPGGDGMPKL
ncbi:acyltransferase ChoActase/COT/CPT [Fomitiporia mediterranea MF3/22]|uniref:acyltransferase ChoActase/COT/CPT n=1 Tax=Fomitiporia mediterranea (strain MF3/22) TaxID=694068 RepID=UPI0004407A91|nr:acyltransferase ChoActase/COT/CPT [Fomitiporia mediterranea MF3/22]EJC98006.1 acyltransferase ChoActase/COT/CPT [Fomitiporia mediterranea MF3/22]